VGAGALRRVPKAEERRYAGGGLRCGRRIAYLFFKEGAEVVLKLPEVTYSLQPSCIGVQN